MDLK
jgi:hypothetical protein